MSNSISEAPTSLVVGPRASRPPIHGANRARSKGVRHLAGTCTVFQSGVREGDGLVEISYGPDPVGCVDADLTITKEATVNADGTAAYSLGVENLGPADATGVVVTDELPACTQFQSDDCGGTAMDGTWTWEIGELVPTSPLICTLTVDASGCTGEGAQVNVATVAGEQEDPVEANNSAETPDRAVSR